jgi:hypothetical protein
MTNLSRPALLVAAAATALGLASGLNRYLDRDEVINPHTPGTEAWIPHLVVLAVVAVWFWFAARRSPLGWKVILAPLGRPIAARIAATFRGGFGPVNLLRCLAVALVVWLEVFMAWRIGQQVFAGLDPNFVHDAWGGPTYAGAMFCHYLDGALLYAVCHTVLRAVTRGSTPTRQYPHGSAHRPSTGSSRGGS